MQPKKPEIAHFKVNKGLSYALLDLAEFAVFYGSNEKRLLEKEAALFVVREVLREPELEILYKASGKPYLQHQLNISISHSSDHLVVLFSDSEDVGVDIEKVRDKIILIRKKFLSAAELQHIQNGSLEEHTVYWSAKEALYKAAGIEGLIFAEQLLIEPFQYSEKGGKINALLKHPGSEKKYTLHYAVLNDHILVYTVFE